MEQSNIYFCDACHYTFILQRPSTQCPDCGKFAVRTATDNEVNEYHRIRAEIEIENQQF